MGKATPEIVGDGTHDDTAGIQALLDGKPYQDSGDFIKSVGGKIYVSGGRFRVSELIYMPDNGPEIVFDNCHWWMSDITPERFEDMRGYPKRFGLFCYR